MVSAALLFDLKVLLKGKEKVSGTIIAYKKTNNFIGLFLVALRGIEPRFGG